MYNLLVFFIQLNVLASYSFSTSYRLKPFEQVSSENHERLQCERRFAYLTPALVSPPSVWPCLTLSALAVKSHSRQLQGAGKVIKCLKMTSCLSPTFQQLRSPLFFPSGPQERHIDFPAVQFSQAPVFLPPTLLRSACEGEDGAAEGTKGSGREANFLKLWFAKVARFVVFFCFRQP